MILLKINGNFDVVFTEAETSQHVHKVHYITNEGLPSLWEAGLSSNLLVHQPLQGAAWPALHLLCGSSLEHLGLVQ